MRTLWIHHATLMTCYCPTCRGLRWVRTHPWMAAGVTLRWVAIAALTAWALVYVVWPFGQIVAAYWQDAMRLK